ncbi:S24 family peptidase [Dysgonomonas sp. Marseille-P4361]|uniref:S24 family peptidase n=1 Tax=Dysgonomonas sp. Marseille-P4361 TaxID=2161820 RepID=UPI001358F0F2|nr:S24 family peptidase [Dysgonomonas sp. Marseille-P4361]
MEVNNRIKEFCSWYSKENKITQKELSGLVDISSSQLSSIINGRDKVGLLIVEKFLNLDTRLDANWLITGKGEMLKEYDKNSQTVFKLKTDYNLNNQFIPLYEIDASAGLITLFDSQITQNPVGEISIPNAPKCDGALYVRGDSMYPILKSGDIVAYKTIHDPNNIFWGEMYLIDIDVEGEQYLTIKYIQRSDKGDDYVYLVSHNGNHQPVHILKSNIRALALVKASIRYNSMG